MAEHTRHPVAAPPAAPVRESTRLLALRAYAVFVLASAFAMSAWNNLIGPVGVGILVGTLGLITAVVWAFVPVLTVRSARDVWRRLPWTLLAYVALGGLSFLWSAWPTTTAITWFATGVTTLQGLFLASVLTWREIVRTIVSALRWVLGLSILFELWVSLFVGHAILPPSLGPVKNPDAHLYWSRDNLFDWDGRIQGIVGNANLLGILAALGIVVFTIAYAARIASLAWTVPWLAACVFLLWRAGSATSVVTLCAVALVAATALIMRTAVSSRRTLWYAVYAVIGVAGATMLLVLREPLLAALGRGSDLTFRAEIWSAVIKRAQQRPVFGWGFATPWLPWDPAFAGWISDHGVTVFMAHDMWLDAYLQLGLLGVFLLAVAMLALIWRAWFFAVDRPRWDLDGRRPYTALSLLPTLIVTILLVQGITESRPLMEWGWLVIVMLTFKIKASPIVGVGPSEQTLALERGDLPARKR